MSWESLDAFRKKLEETPELREKLLSARAKATMQVAAEEGFTITLLEARDEVTKWYTELDDEHLEAVAGGILQIPWTRGDETPA
jgi:predicted ribosomally synthesized peptide with nif11-like leader